MWSFSRSMTLTGDMLMRSRVRAQRRAMKCCWRPDLSHRPQRSEILPKNPVARPTRGTRRRYESHRRANGGCFECRTGAETLGSETERTPSVFGLVTAETGFSFAVG